MMKGFYTAASGIFVQQRNINVIGNNIANSQTPGFKTDRVVTSTFSQLVERIENRNKAIIGSESPVSFVDEVPVNLLDSSVEETDRPFDMTLIDEGYFNIAGQDKTYMTRNGNFDVDNEGYLVLEGVGRVLGAKWSY
jgi:flagellar hook-basal body protein